MFDNCERAEFDEESLLKLGEKMIADKKEIPEKPEDEKLDDENPTLPAGYTYLGQFIDHDLTFDPVPVSTLQRTHEQVALVNLRTPRFDLDCVYGEGPDDQPYLYQKGRRHLLLGDKLQNGNWDVPRIMRGSDVDEPSVNRSGFAIIGDPRNDESVIIAQLHAIFLRFHNRMAGELDTSDFAEIQRSVRWHYQWVVLYDFLPRVVDRATYAEVLPHVQAAAEDRPPLVPKSDVSKDPPQLRFSDARENAYIPIEFSGAAYRFGHSMVRPFYRLNRKEPQRVGGPIPILGDDIRNDLRGFRLFRRDWAIEWGLFFDRILKEQPTSGKGRVQHALKIDTSLSDPLGQLPFEFARDKGIKSLAQRNLIRGWRDLQLPSGQAVAKAMEIEPLKDYDLKVRGNSLTGISPNFKDNAPLWYYVLAEAEKSGGEHLGRVGSRIVMETFVDLMLKDHDSLLHQNWEPHAAISGDRKVFGMAEFINAATAT